MVELTNRLDHENSQLKAKLLDLEEEVKSKNEIPNLEELVKQSVDTVLNNLRNAMMNKDKDWEERLQQCGQQIQQLAIGKVSGLDTQMHMVIVSSRLTALSRTPWPRKLRSLSWTTSCRG